MTVKSIRVAPPNSVVAISDISGGEAPEPKRKPTIQATSSCVVVGCMSETDGETNIVLGDAKNVAGQGEPAFDQLLHTPSRVIAIWTVDRQIILKADTGADETRLRIWLDDPSYPSEVVIALG